MDLSVVAAVGSFFVSERVLKPKATVLVFLGIILCYDLTTKTHDVSSLRVYRGPAMLAFTLFMAAFSLRTWRRNGVACDELIFLPGTPHGVVHGVDSPGAPAVGRTSDAQQSSSATGTTTAVPQSILTAQQGAESSGNNNNNNNNITKDPCGSHSEGDVAAGGPPHPDAAKQLDLRRRSRSMEEELANNSNHNYHRSATTGDVEMTTAPSQNADSNRRTHSFQATRSDSFDSSLGWDSDEDENNRGGEDEQQNLMEGAESLDPSTETPRRGCLSGRGGAGRMLCRTGSIEEEDLHRSVVGGDEHNNQQQGMPSHSNHGPLDLRHFRENHPQITRTWSFFFFRSPTTSTHNAVYAPSGPNVVGAALDLSMPILFNFHIYIEAYNHIQGTQGNEAPAKILPLIFFSVLIVRSAIPPGRRGRFWSTMKFTAMAPFHRVRFRDAFIGDIMTSWVRPGQDFLFALSYYVTVIWGTVTGQYGLSESGRILEGSWLLHNVILPSCALLPLWWKFLQTLRQAYDEEKRWPHLGNAFKYLTATMVILYGMTHPEDRTSFWWIMSFLTTLLYQIWWDIFVDWELFEIPPPGELTLDVSSENIFSNISSLRPDSHIMLTLQMYVFTPISEMWRRLCVRVASLQHIRLRSRRLYKTQEFYWKICAYNAIMRFTWMLCFIPAYRLSSSGEEKVAAFSSDVDSYVGVFLPIAEIIRRCLWGLIMVELKTIKMTESDMSYSQLDNSVDYRETEIGSCDDENDDDDGQLSGGDHSQAGKTQLYLPLWLNAQQQMQHETSSSSINMDTLPAAPMTTKDYWRKAKGCFKVDDAFMHRLFVTELCVWAGAFVFLGCWAAS